MAANFGLAGLYNVFVFNNSDYLKKACKYGQITGQGHRIYYQITTFGMSLDTLTTSRELSRHPDGTSD